jgi:membrane protein
LPGAVIAAVFWIVASYAMGLYFQNFAHFNKTYGTLGAAVALMVWLYWSWFIVLLGAQINLQLLKEKNYELPLKQPRRVPAQMPPSEQRKVRDRGAA